MGINTLRVGGSRQEWHCCWLLKELSCHLLFLFLSPSVLNSLLVHSRHQETQPTQVGMGEGRQGNKPTAVWGGAPGSEVGHPVQIPYPFFPSAARRPMLGAQAMHPWLGKPAHPGALVRRRSLTCPRSSWSPPRSSWSTY